MEQVKHNKDITFKLLEVLTNEDLPENEQSVRLYEEYNKLQELAHQNLFSLAEETPYPRKFEILERVRELLLTVRLHMLIPELNDKLIVGFYRPSKALLDHIWQKWLMKALPQSLFDTPRWKRWLAIALPKSLSSNPILSGVPTLITPAAKDAALSISAISIGEKRLELIQEDYVEMLCQDKKDPEAEERVELSGLTHLLIVSSEQLPEHQCVLVLPDGCSENSKYFSALLGLIDTLVLSDPTLQTDKITWLDGSNVKRVIYYGARSAKTADELLLRNFSAVCETAKNFSALKLSKNAAMPNSNHSLVLQSIISEVLWYLGVQRHSLNERLKTVNSDLLGEDALTIIREIKETVTKQLDISDSLCKRYLSLLADMTEHLENLSETPQGTSEAAASNIHVLSPAALIGHFFRLGVFYEETDDHSKNTINDLRKLQKFCSRHDTGHLANIIANDYFKTDSSPDDYKALKTNSSPNPFIVRLKLRHNRKLGLDDSACGKLAQDLPQPRTPEEERMLGIYYNQCGQSEQAREALHSAMLQGDTKAGNSYVKLLCSSADQKSIDTTKDAAAYADALKEAAAYGIAEAAAVYGYSKMQQWKNSQQSDSLFKEALKFLNIAAAGGHKGAMSNLSELWYLNGFRLLAQNGTDDENMKSSFQAFLQNVNKNSTAKQKREQIGTASFYLKQYKEAIEYLEKAKTGDACKLLGYMYETGTGTAQDRAKALEKYEESMQLGNSQARVEYDRLFAELEAEKKAKEESERASYSATSYYSGYYSSYYSGW